MEMLPESTMTFQELTDWYLNLKKVKKKKSYVRIEQALNNFNTVFGNKVADDIKPTMLEDYQIKRKEQGRAYSTIDKEMIYSKAVVKKAFYNDMVDGRVLKVFESAEKLKKEDNARKRTMGFDEYISLIDNAPQHLKAFIIVAFNTGMRVSELRLLKWSYVDKVNGIIRLPADITKEKKPKNIPVNHHVKKVLDLLPRSIIHDFVFTYKGQPVTSAGGLKRSFRTACGNAKITFGRDTENGLIFHDIRRTVKTNMVAAGLDKVCRDVILGHSLKGMDKNYIHPSDNDLKNAMEKYTCISMVNYKILTILLTMRCNMVDNDRLSC
jgi:integrase